MFSFILQTEIIISATFNLSSANAFYFEPVFKVLSCGRNKTAQDLKLLKRFAEDTLFLGKMMRIVF